MTVHNIMAFNHQFLRPQPPAGTKVNRAEEKTQSFQDILNEKMKLKNGKHK
jgi:hypothetical protein